MKKGNQPLVAGLFAGIGGIELGLARSGFSTAMLCEIDPGATEILKERFPDVPLKPDVRRVEPADLHGVHLLTAGFPCQDLSQAGATNGINGKHSGLVNHVFRILEHIRIPWILLENVPFMLKLNKGHAMGYLVHRLECLGYRWAYRVIDTRSFGIPQRRERVFLLASLEEDPAPRLLAKDEGALPAYSHRGRPCGFYWTEGNRGLGWAVDSIPTLKGGSGLGIPSPPAVWLPDGTFVTPALQSAEALQGFEPGWTEPAERQTRPTYRWKLVGNAVTVDVASWLGEQLLNTPFPLTSMPVPLAPSSPWPNAAFGSSEGRFSVSVSPWPVRRDPLHLKGYLELGFRALSKKAATGFTERLKRSKLKYPPEFLSDLENYISRS